MVMVISINTNVGAMIALQNLNKTNDAFTTTKERVSSGLRVNAARDDAAAYSLAQKMRSEVSGYKAVKEGLGLADATIGVAIKAGESIQKLLTEMKGKVVKAQSDTLTGEDRKALKNEVDKLEEQIQTIVKTSVFNDTNLISKDAKPVVFLSSLDGKQEITIPTRSMEIADLRIGRTYPPEGVVDANLPNLNTAANAKVYAGNIDDALSSVRASLAVFGSVSNQIDVQSKFTGNLINVVKKGISVMVDADMASESAMLKALQVKQNLGVQALGIANASPQSILTLFG
jgi:flagellin